MNIFDEDTERMLVQSAKSFADTSHNFARVRALHKHETGFDLHVWQEMGRLGWTGILLPEQLGGSALPVSAALALAEIFGQRLLPEPLIPAGIIAATLLSHSSTPEAHAVAHKLAEGCVAPTLAFQETLAQLDTASPQTLLEKSPSGFTLTGKKIFVPVWTDAAPLMITAMSPNGLAVILLQGDAAGISINTRRMSDGTMAADLNFKDVAISPDQIMLSGATADAALKLAVARGILGSCAQLNGMAHALLSMTVDYVQQRVQFGKPLATKQALRHRLVDLKAQLELASASWRAAAAKIENGAADADQSISMAKARCSDTALDIGKAAIQYHGAFGYTEEADIGLYMNTALRFAAYLGNASYHKQRALELHLAGRNLNA